MSSTCKSNPAILKSPYLANRSYQSLHSESTTSFQKQRPAQKELPKSNRNKNYADDSVLNDITSELYNSNIQEVEENDYDAQREKPLLKRDISP